MQLIPLNRRKPGGLRRIHEAEAWDAEQPAKNIARFLDGGLIAGAAVLIHRIWKLSGRHAGALTAKSSAR